MPGGLTGAADRDSRRPSRPPSPANARSGAVGHGAARPTHRGSSAPASWSPGPAEWNRRPVRIIRQLGGTGICPV